LTATESLSCFKQQWQGGYRHKSPYCVVYLLSQVVTWFELFVAFCILYFVSSAEKKLCCLQCLVFRTVAFLCNAHSRVTAPPAGEINEMTRSKIRSIYCSRVKDPSQ